MRRGGRKGITARRSHYSMQANGVVDTGVQTQANSIGACCKLWFPCDEGSGDTITDVITGISLQLVNGPTETDPVDWSAMANSVEGHFPGGAPTSGDITGLAPGLKDFIFLVHNGLLSGNRGAISDVHLAGTDGSTSKIGISDGESWGWKDTTSSNYFSGQTVTGPGDITPAPSEYVTAIIRSNGYTYFWHDYDLMVDPNHADAYGYGDCDWGDYFLSHSVPGFPVMADTGSYKIDGVATVYTASPPNCLLEVYESVQIPNGNITFASNVMRIGTAPILLELGATRFGIALFVFENGMPSDWQDALRWMRQQWKVGNKVLWPGWSTLE